MEAEQFKQLVKGVTEMRQHMRGKKVAGAVTTSVKPIDAPMVKKIRESAKVSQSQFAQLIDVSVRTLQNWEQQRTRPTSPARALLQIVASNPKALKALHS
jgi:putative transcriptional regulator